MTKNNIFLNNFIRYNIKGQIYLQQKYRSINFFTYYKFLSILVKIL